MKIAVLSGKGGTGKTLVSVNLATVGGVSAYVDCDVEEPNGYLFFKPEDIQEEKVAIDIPQVDNALCDGCRKCVDFCKYNALAYIKDQLMIFEDVCHSCGGCTMFCPKKALTEKKKVIGKVQKGISDEVKVYTGVLNTGEASGIPIIKKLLDESKQEDHALSFIDCPPGSSCAVMESIKEVDYCILVAEPTLFGLHNMNMVYQLIRLFHKPCGVVLNKCLDGHNPVERFCLEKNIKILGSIPFDQELGMLNSNAEIAARKKKKYSEIFSSLLKTVEREVQHEAIAHS